MLACLATLAGCYDDLDTGHAGHEIQQDFMMSRSHVDYLNRPGDGEIAAKIGVVYSPWYDSDGTPQMGESGYPLRGTCGVTFVTPVLAVTAAHCVPGDRIPDPERQPLTVEQYDVEGADAAHLALFTEVTGAWPAYQSPQLTAFDGYRLIGRHQCHVVARCEFGDYRCPLSVEADVAVLRCGERATGDYSPIAPDDPAHDDDAGIANFWLHEVHDMPIVASDDRFDHYTVWDPADKGRNFHYHGSPINQMLPLRSLPWPTGAPRRRLGRIGTEIRTDIPVCHGTSGSGVFAPTELGRHAYLGPMSAARGVGDRLCNHGLYGADPVDVEISRFIRPDLVQDALPADPALLCGHAADRCHHGTTLEYACPAGRANDGYCDQGCQFADPDCVDRTACGPGSAVGRCWSHCGPQADECWVDARSGTPELTVCPAERIGDGVTCDVGCTVRDPDCDVETQVTVRRSGTGTGQVTSNVPGIDCGDTCDATFAPGPSIVLHALPAAGSLFSGWTGCAQASGAQCTLVKGRAQTVSARFTRPTLTVRKVTPEGTSGTVSSIPSGIWCGLSCTAAFSAGTVVTLTATPGPNSELASWSGACTGSGTTCTVSMTQSREVTATFRGRFVLSVGINGLGDVQVTPPGSTCTSSCSRTYQAVTQVTLAARASTADCQRFAGWSGACTGSGATCTLRIAGPATATATFTRIASCTPR